MKRKSKRFIVSLILGSALLFSSCGVVPAGGGTTPGGGGGGGGGSGGEGGAGGTEIVVPEPTDIPEDIPEPTESDITPEQGVDEKTEETLEKALKLFKSPLSVERFEKIVSEYAIEHKISNKVADGVLKIIIYIYEQVQSRGGANISSIEYIDNLFKLAKEIRLVDMFLAIQYFANVLTGVEANDNNIFDYTWYQINGVSHADLDKLEKIANSTGSSSFRTVVDDFKAKFDSLYVDPEIEGFGYESRQGFFLPEAAISMMDQLSEADQLGIVRMWEQLVAVIGLERIGQIADSVVDMTGGKSGYSPYGGWAEIIIDGMPQYLQLYKYLITGGGSEGGMAISEIVNLVTLKDIRALVAILLKDEKNASTLLSVATSFVLPAIQAGYADTQTPEAKRALEAFINSLKTLKGSNITVVGRLLDGVLALFTEEEFNTMKSYIPTMNTSAIISLALQKKNDVAALINNLSASDKASITGLSNVLGFDFNAFLGVAATNIVNVVSLDDEVSMNALNNIATAAMELPKAVKNKIGPAFNFGGDYHLDIYLNGTGYLETNVLATNETIDELLRRVDPNFSIYSFSSDGMGTVLYFNYSRIPENYSVSFEADTSKAGIVGLKFTVKFNDITLVKTLPLKVYEKLNGDLIAVSGNPSGSVNTYNNYFYLNYYHTSSESTAFYSVLSDYVVTADKTVSFSASNRKAGWNVFESTYRNNMGQLRSVYAPYYYIGEDSEGQHQTIVIVNEYHVGCFVNDSSGSTGQEYIRFTTITRDFELYKVKTVEDDYGTINPENKEFSSLGVTFSEAGEFTRTVGDKKVVYHVMSKNNSMLANLDFEFELTNLVSEDSPTYSAESFTGKISKTYQNDAEFTFNGEYHAVSAHFTFESSVTVTNFSFDGNNIAFDLDGYHYYTMVY